MTKEPAQFTFTGADGATTWSISAWSGDGTATFAARGSTRHLALEGALSASLALALDIADRGSAGEGSRATPIRGEGEDLWTLFADMLDELGDAVALHGLG
ncbi:MAG: hypothetical protein IT338_20665, partial [Thermomicrobiales bacterium]|nr:hypothetical protein [Thermomicrobiales bacterium]